jgi:hypothetical protein
MQFMTFSTTMQQPTFYKVLFFNGLGRDVKIAQRYLEAGKPKKLTFSAFLYLLIRQFN